MDIGLIPVLRRMLLKTYSRLNTSSRAVLCHEGTVHIAGQLCETILCPASRPCNLLSYPYFLVDKMWGCGTNMMVTVAPHRSP